MALLIAKVYSGSTVHSRPFADAAIWQSGFLRVPFCSELLMTFVGVNLTTTQRGNGESFAAHTYNAMNPQD